MSPVVDLHVWGVRRSLPAMRRMATGRRHLRDTPGLRFARLLGTGSGRSFAPRDADPHHWALLTVWDDAAAADRGPDRRVTAAWEADAHERLRVRLRPLGSRGRWAGQEPFGELASPSATRHDGPVAAITRARLRPTTARSFRRAVPAVVRDLHASPGVSLAIGIGEAPVLLQGTFSLWSSATALEDFAHRSAAHRAAVRRTGPARWYAEELFARFAVDTVEGTYDGRTP